MIGGDDGKTTSPKIEMVNRCRCTEMNLFCLPPNHEKVLNQNGIWNIQMQLVQLQNGYLKTMTENRREKTTSKNSMRCLFS